MRILIAEDDPALARTLELGLRRAEFAVDVVHDGQAALHRLRVYDYDVLVLDRDLPGVHGDEVCRRTAQERTGCRILMLTAADGVDATVDGLTLGADDYLTKPFAFPELIARIRTLGRRESGASAPILRWDDVTLDTYRRTAARGGADLRLTGKELAVLELLVRSDGAPLSADDLLDKAWSTAEPGSANAVRLVIASLRRKIGEPGIVETVVGAGYRLVSP
jgi:DNA-binding response OmpR family regulator